MQHIASVLATTLLLTPTLMGAAAPATISIGTLLGEMSDLGGFA